jgi:hypothetical protein
MKSFKKLRRELEEHPNLRTRIVKAINPMEKIRDKMADLKKKGGLTGIAKTKLKKELDKINPLSPINKMKTKSTKEKIKKLSAKKKGHDTTSAGLGLKIKDLRKEIEPK